MMRLLALSFVVAVVPCAAGADLYDFNGTPVLVDYWADDGSATPSHETIVVIDWNNTHGPYLTEAHAWGYRWSGSGTVLDALTAIESAGPLDVEFGFGGGFVTHAHYSNTSIDSDDHRTTDHEGWVWTAGSSDGGLTWELNGGALDGETLADGHIEGLNWNPGDWTGENLTIPVPEPGALLTIFFGISALVGRYRR